MRAELILSKLERVRRTGSGRWVACCPAHGSGRNTALKVTLLPDGRLLLHCFAGCAFADVLTAASIEVGDLMPETMSANEAGGDRRYSSRATLPFDARQMLGALHGDVLVAAVVVADVLAGRPADTAALWRTAGRLADAVEVLNARR